jgi:hypothetical protein
LFSKNSSLYPSLRMKDQVLYPYKTTSDTTYILIFMLSGSALRKEDYFGRPPAELSPCVVNSGPLSDRVTELCLSQS